MGDNDQLLNTLKSIDKRLDGLEQGQKRLERGQQQLAQGQSHTNTALEAVKAGQDDIHDTMATNAEMHDLRVEVVNKIKDHESRIEDLEKETGIPHPHKH